MDLLNGNEYNRSNHYCQHHGIIYHIFLGFTVVKGREEFHETISHDARYKTALPFVEMLDLQNKIHTYYQMWGCLDLGIGLK